MFLYKITHIALLHDVLFIVYSIEHYVESNWIVAIKEKKHNAKMELLET